jgi:uncharacterized protein YlxP (DUF503 family)
VLQAELRMPWAESLKDKRRVVRSVKDRLHREHQVSVAEVAAHDLLTVAVLGVALASTDGRRAGDVLDAVERKLRELPDAEVAAVDRQILRGTDGALPGADEEEDAAGVSSAELAAELEARGERELRDRLDLDGVGGDDRGRRPADAGDGQR